LTESKFSENSSVCASRRRFLTVAGSTLLLAGCAGTGALNTGTAGDYAQVNGTRLYYEIAGSGDTVILLHAFMLDTRMWDEQFNTLAQRYRVIRYDARGFGRSALPDSKIPYSHADDLKALMLAQNIDRAHLVGASMGGHFAIDFALKYPQQCRSLSLIDSVIGGWQWSPQWLASYAPIIHAAEHGDIAGAKAAWLAHPIFNSARAKSDVYAHIRKMVSDYSGWHFTHADPVRPLNPPALGRLGQIRAPVLSITGAQDLLEFQRMAKRLEHDAHARPIVVADAGHLPNLEAPQPVNRALGDFLSAI
jgi:pimeloyl-ACP methyl ester carboxylesterase